MDEFLQEEIALARATPGCQFGRYLILTLLGKGGMGTVHRAWDPTLEREVAIKVIHKAAAQVDPVAMERFLLEARATARLNHSAIVQVYEVGEHEDSPYIVMDLVPGRHLLQHIREGLSRDELLRLLAKVARGLHHAHCQGILHRDLKPENIVIHKETGQPLLMDFGLAVDILSDAKLTAEGMVVGTPAYMAPEQAHGGKVGATVDVYGLGAVLYRALCGQPPFDGNSPMGTMVKVVNEPLVPPGKLRSDIPDALEAIVLRCLEKKPKHRYASAAALADELERFLATGSSEAAAGAEARRDSPRVAAPRAKPPAAEPNRSGRSEGQSSGRSTSRRLALGGPLLAVVAFVVMLWGHHLFTRKVPEPEAPVAVEAKTVTIWSPKAGLILGGARVLVEGRLDAGDLEEVWVAGQALSVTEATLEFSGEVNLPTEDGLCELLVWADPHGEQPLGAVEVVVDRTDPVITLVAPADDSVLLGAPRMRLEAEVVDANLATVSVSVGRGPLKPVPSNQPGRFEIILEMDLADEDQVTVEVIARDEAGNEAIREVLVTMDQSPPTVHFSDPPVPEITREEVVMLRGWVQDRHPWRLLVDGEPVELGALGAFSVPVRLEVENQARDVVLRAEDAAGHLSDEQRRSFVLDKTPPSLELESQGAVVTSAAWFLVRGVARDANGVALVEVDGERAAMNDQGRFSADVSLDEGQNRILVAVVDVAGNREEQEVLATRDSMGPVISLDQEPPEKTSRVRRLKVSGKLDEDGCTVLLNGDALDVEDRAFKGKYLLVDGENLIVIVASDALGNQTRLERTVTYSRRRSAEGKKTEQKGFLVHIYRNIPRNSRRIPDFSTMQYSEKVVIEALDFDGRDDFESGLLPGLDRAEQFALRILATFEAPVSGEYVFTLSSDDGSRLWINDTMLIDNDGTHGDRSRDFTVSNLRKGTSLRLRVDYFQAGGGASLKLYVRPPGQFRRLIRFDLSSGDGD